MSNIRNLKGQDTSVIRRKALKLVDSGLTSAQVARRLRLRKMTVAAWIAHRTMGTY